MRTIIVGDIHGCFYEFQELLNKTKLDPENDRLILLGDLMDRGENSWEVFHYVKEQKLVMGERLTVLRGNHEDMLLSSYASSLQDSIWKKNGKRKTVESFCRHEDNIRSHVDWFRRNTQIYVKEEWFQCVHAGLTGEDLSKADPYDLFWDRSVVERNQYGGPLTIAGHTPLSSPAWFDGSGGEPVELRYGVWTELPKHGMIGMDTGCVFGGRLTGMIIEKNRFFLDYVDSKHPSDTGTSRRRNV